MTKKSPNPVDIHVGNRVRMRRVLIGMSQEKLGEELGLTFQQVQKYEKGANRIGASRLFHISKILNVPVSFFFDDIPGEMSGALGEGAQAAFAADVLTSSEGIALNRAFFKIEDAGTRRKIIDLVRAIGDAAQA